MFGRPVPNNSRVVFPSSLVSGEVCNISLRVANGDVVPLVYSVHRLSTHVDHEILYAALILFFVYVLIIFEVVCVCVCV